MLGGRVYKKRQKVRNLNMSDRVQTDAFNKGHTDLEELLVVRGAVYPIPYVL